MSFFQRSTVKLAISFGALGLVGLPFSVPTSALPAFAQSGAGVWRSLAPLPTPRSEVGAAEVNGLIYVVGGFDAAGFANEAYDPRADSWSARAPLPRPLNHPAAAGLNGKLYVVGGADNQTGRSVASLYEYDPAADAWTERASMPTARNALGAVALNGLLYAVGGIGVRDVATNEVYDPSTD